MIDQVVGAMGSGKGMFFMRHIWDDIVSSNCYITTNFAIRLDPWQNGQGQLMKGLIGCLKEQFGETFDLRARLRILTDEETAVFWRHPYVGLNMADVPTVEKAEPGTTEKVAYPDYSILAEAERKTVRFYIDEAPDYWDNMKFADITPECKHALRHSRKFGWDIWFACQDMSQLAKPLRVFIHNTYVMRNFWHERIGVFRHRKIIRWERFFKVPVGVNPKPMASGKMDIDTELLGQCYDTTAGVGVRGGFQADKARKERGLPFWTLPAGVVGLLLLFWFGWMAFGKFVGHKMASTVTHLPSTVGSTGPLVTPALPETNTPPVIVQHYAQFRHGADVSVVDRVNADSNVVYMVGQVAFGTHLMVFLSDGRRFDSEDGRLQHVTADGCMVSGTYYPFDRVAVARSIESSPLVRDARNAANHKTSPLVAHDVAPQTNTTISFP